MKLYLTFLILLLCAGACAQQKGQKEFTESFMQAVAHMKQRAVIIFLYLNLVIN